MKKAIVLGNAEGLPLSEAILAGGFAFVSGQIGNEPDSDAIPDGILAQTKNAFLNVERVLTECGMCLDDIVKVQVVLTTKENFSEFNRAYNEIFKGTKPARTSWVADLTIAALLEVDVIAALKEST